MVLKLGLALQLRIAQTRRLKATAYGGGVSRLPKFGEVTELVSGSPWLEGLPPWEEQMVNVRVNGQERAFDGDPSMPLMWFLRDELGLTGTKFGCGASLCGACTVHINGEAIRSCAIVMSDVAGKSVTTIEGLDPKGQHPVQIAWRDLSVPQCGYCQAGQIMQAAALLAKTPAPSDKQIDDAMAGNICRCGCYQRIHAAVRAASKGA
jgi:isoquinoline 1-oxidoreductase subunit alpha